LRPDDTLGDEQPAGVARALDIADANGRTRDRGTRRVVET
jgi:hypothetical protein